MTRDRAATFYFSCHRKLFSYDMKTLREDRTAAEWKMSLARPAAGGESCKAGFFLVFRMDTINPATDRIIINSSVTSQNSAISDWD